jgi:hypothetical protein
VGHWEGDTLVIETSNVTEWPAPCWPHSDAFRITERWFFKDASELTITGLRPANPPKVEGRLLINEMTMNDSKWSRKRASFLADGAAPRAAIKCGRGAASGAS